MNKDRIDGAAHEAAGKVKQATGKAIGDTTLEAKGFAEKTAGKAQNTMGKVEDKLRKS